MQVQSCCFACLNLLLFCRSRCRRRRRCSNSLVIRTVRGMAHARTKMAFFFAASKKPSEFLDCLRLPSHKIRLVLISSSAIANHDVIIIIETPSFLTARGFAARVLRFRVQ